MADQAPQAETELANRLRTEGQQHGLVGFGICDAAPFPEVQRTLRSRLAEGTAGKLTFTYRNPATSTDVRRSFSWARRLVVGAASYMPDGGGPGPPSPGSGRVARFAVEDFYPRIRVPLKAIAGLLGESGYRTSLLIDDNRLVDRAAAVRAGVGWWGKNSMVLAPKFGPWLLLGSVVTDAMLPTSQPMRRDCGTCAACLPACPTGALIAPGVLDASRCLAHWTQVPGVIPEELRVPMDDRIYGCDDCLDACPPGSRLLSQAQRTSRGRVDLTRLLRSSDRELLEQFDHFYIPRREARYLRRNALVALGNRGTEAHVLLLEEYLGGDDWLLRLHAAWALGRITSHRATNALRTRQSVEEDERVRNEIERALAGQETVAQAT